MKYRHALPLLLCAALVWLNAAAHAQSTTANIVGTVKNTAGEVVPGAEVVITHLQTNKQISVQTNGDGYYRSTPLAVGDYRVEVRREGFRRAVHANINLLINQVAVVDATLEIGAVAELVEVTAQAPALETTTAAMGKVLDNRRILELPLNSRNVYSLIALTPGYSGSVGNAYNEQNYSVNGARARAMDTLIDGVTATFPTVNGGVGISVFPSVDAIQEYKVLGATYAAEYGRSQGSVTNLIYKSGTNQLHGTAYEFLRNSVFDANNWFDNRRGAALGSFKRSQFGGHVTGPIRKDKTFFMGSFEGLRQRSFATRTFTVPTLLERAGDFSKTLNQAGAQIRAFNPFTTRANPNFNPAIAESATNFRFIRDQFTDNKVPTALFDPVAINVLKYIPLPNQAGDAGTNANNYISSGSAAVNLDNYDVRIDHRFTEKQNFFARYSHRYTEDVPLKAFPAEITVAEGRVIQENRARNIVLEHTWTLSPSSILVSRLGFARTLFVFSNQSLGFKPSSLGLPATIDAAADRQMFPRFNVSNIIGGGFGGNDHRFNAFMSYPFVASLTQTRGNHTLKFGGEIRMIRVNVWEARDSASFSFTAGMTQGPNPNAASSSAGNAFASFLLGAGSSGTLIQAWKNVAAQNFYNAAYMQDDWRITRKLTLNLGLRYDYDTPRTERYNRVNFFDPNAPSPLASKVPAFPNLKGGLVFVGVNGRDRYQYNKDTNNLAPRFGFAYQLNDKTVVRGGYGHIFGPSPQAAQGTVGPFGFRVENPWVNSIDGITPTNLLRNPFPQGFSAPRGAADGLLTALSTSIQAPLQNTVTPWSQQWSLNVQRTLPWQVTFEAAYVGSRSLQLSRGGEGGYTLNQLDPQYMALGSQLNVLVDNPFFGLVTTGVLASAKVARGQLLRPYPQFLDVIPLFSGGGSAIYHSMQLSFSKRFSHGFTFDGNYTWAKNIEEPESNQNAYNLRAGRSLAGIDIAHRFVLSYLYELPFGKGKRFGSNAHWLVNTLIGGWQFNGITLLQTGTPLSISASNTAGVFSQAIRANNNGQSAKLSGPVHERLGDRVDPVTRKLLNPYFNTSVFSQPDPFTFGNVSTTLPDVRNDGIHNFDLSLFKAFKPVERMSVQFRIEALNAFNTPRFGGPNTGVTSTTFGQITSQANAPRQMQFALKLLW